MQMILWRQKKKRRMYDGHTYALIINLQSNEYEITCGRLDEKQYKK